MFGLVSKIEPTTVDEPLSYDGWILVMQDNLNIFKRNDAWDLVPKPKQNKSIGTKRVFKNKRNKKGKVFRNKARLVA